MAACVRCGAENPGGARFCAACGAPLADACPQCGQELPADGRFCPHCGALARGVEDVPKALKLATILFADVVSSTARAERMDPEDVHLLMSDFFGAMTEEIEREGGTIDKFLGDAVMAVFGVPVSHEDDPVRAVRAAKRMLARLGRWNTDKEPERRIEIRLGINTGQVHAAGTPGRDLTITGDAVNVAARLEQAAAVGQIVIGERTAREARRYFRLRDLEPLDLKGKSSPVRAWVVEDELTVVQPRGVLGLSAPLIGRADELELLRTMLTRVQRDRSPQLVTVTGDAGVGKTRLAREFVAPLAGETRVLIGRCLPYGEGVTLWPLNEILKSEAGIFDTDPHPHVMEKIEKLVRDVMAADLAPDPDRTTAALASTLDIQVADGPLAGLDPREAYRELRYAWRAFLSSMAVHATTIVVVEDIHWAGGPMLDLLDDLAEGTQGPILFVCPARPDLFKNRPDWGGGRRNFSSIALNPLSADDSDMLVSSLLDVEHLPAVTHAEILGRAEGNPFFLEEIVHRLIDEEQLVYDEGRWRAAATISSVEIPDNVHGVIASRLDLLAPLEKEVVQHGSVIGRVFWAGAIAHLCVTHDLDDVMATLQRRELIEPRVSSSMPGETEYSFKHILIRDVAYDSLPRSIRSRTHAAVAAWLERSTGETGERAELLAYHYSEAYAFLREDALRRKARSYSLTAAENAVRRVAFAEAERLGERAVELSSSGTERVEALETLAHTTFKGHIALECYREALDELRNIQPFDRATFVRLSTLAATLPTRWRGSMQVPVSAEVVRDLISQGLEMAGGEDSRERAMLLACKAFFQIQGYSDLDDEGRAAARAAVEMAERLGDVDLISAALDAAGSISLSEGRYADLYDICRRRLALVPQLTDVSEICDSYNMAAWSSTVIGRYPEAVGFATKAIERAKGLYASGDHAGGPGGYLHGLIWRVYASFMAGDWDAALADQSEIERLQEASPEAVMMPMTTTTFGIAALCAELRGDDLTASAYLDKLRAYRDEQATARSLSGQMPLDARALIHRGSLDEAESWLNLDHGQARAVNLEILCEIAGARGDAAMASEAWTMAREESHRCGLLALGYFADRLEGRTVARTDPARAQTHLRRSIAGFTELGAPWEAAWSQLLLSESLIEEGATDEAEKELLSAQQAFDERGSIAESARCHDLRASLGLVG